MTVTTERPTDSEGGIVALEEPSSRTALRTRPKGRHRAPAATVHPAADEMSHGRSSRR